MEIKYLQFLYFLKNNKNENIANTYQNLVNACRSLKEDTKNSLEIFMSILDVLNSEISKKHNINIENIYSFYKDNNLITDQMITELNNIEKINQDQLYTFSIKVLDLIYNLSITYFSRVDYIQYFKSLYTNQTGQYKRQSKNGKFFQETVNVRTVYEKIEICINSLKTYPEEAIKALRDAFIGLGQFISKDGTLQNKDFAIFLRKNNYIDNTEEKVLFNLITTRNDNEYGNVKLNKEDIDLIINSLEIIYKIVKKKFPNTMNKKDKFEYIYFPIDGGKVLYYLENKGKNGQHLGTYYTIKEGNYGLKYSQVIRMYDKQNVDNNLLKHDNSGYELAINGLFDKELSNKYYLTRKDIPSKNYIFEYVCYNIPDNYLQLKYTSKFTVKQIEQIIYNVAQALYNLTKVEPIIHHRNINLDTVFYSIDNNGNVSTKIGYFEHAKIKKSQVVTVYIEALKNKSYFVPPEAEDNSSIDINNYDWELFDVYSLGRLFTYLLFNKEEKTNDDNILDKLDKFDISMDVKKLISSMTSEVINKRPKLEQIIIILKEELKNE